MLPDATAMVVAGQVVPLVVTAFPMLVLGGLLAYLGFGCLRHAAGKPKGVAIGYASIGAIWIVAGLFVAALLPILHGLAGVAALATAFTIVTLLKRL